jgi:hypothetical protein
MTDDKTRPADSAAPKGRVVMSWRITTEFRAWLRAQAAANRRSVLKEVEARLVESRTIEQDLGGPRILALLKALVAHARVRHGDSDGWLDDASQYSRTVGAWGRLLADWGPRTPVVLAHPRRLTLRGLPLDLLTREELQQLETIWRRICDELRARGELPPDQGDGIEERVLGFGPLDEPQDR